MDVTACAMVSIVIVSAIALVGVLYGGYRLWHLALDSMAAWWNKTPPPPPSQNTNYRYVGTIAYKTVAVVGVIYLFFLAVANFNVVPCNEKERAALGIKSEPVKVAGIPCPCGCGQHK
jgi:hypothetical protein